MTYLPPEIIEHTLKFADTSTLQTCLNIPYLTDMVQKLLDKRYKQCLKSLIKLGMKETDAIIYIKEGIFCMYFVRKNLTDFSVINIAQFSQN